MEQLPEMTLSPIVPLLAIAVAMMLFAAVIIAGAALLRRLGIVAEPPDCYRFQAPCPAPQSAALDPQAARKRAQQRRALQPVYDQARATFEAWAQIKDGLYTLGNSPELAAVSSDAGAVPEGTALVSAWQERAEALHQELETLLPKLATDSKAQRKVEGLHTKMMTLHAEVETLWLAQGYGAAGRGRLILLAVLLSIVIIWAVIIFGVI